MKVVVALNYTKKRNHKPKLPRIFEIRTRSSAKRSDKKVSRSENIFGTLFSNVEAHNFSVSIFLRSPETEWKYFRRNVFP